MSYVIQKQREVNAIVYEHYGGILPKGCVTIIAGQGSSGKSTLLCYLAEHFSSEAKVVLVSNEEDAGIIRGRLNDDGQVDIISFSANEGHAKITKEDVLEIIDLYDIIFVDSLVTLNGGKDINKSGTAEALLSPFIGKVVGTNKSLVFLHHTNKGGGDSLQDMVSGSERLVSGVRHCRLVLNDRLNNRRFLAMSKDNTGLPLTNYEIIAAQKTLGCSATIVVTDLVSTTEDMDKIVYMNTRAAKIKLWDKELAKMEKTDPPAVIQRVLKHFSGRTITPSDVQELGVNEYKYFSDAVTKNGDKWVVREKANTFVTYKFTEDALDWLTFHS